MSAVTGAPGFGDGLLHFDGTDVAGSSARLSPLVLGYRLTVVVDAASGVGGVDRRAGCSDVVRLRGAAVVVERSELGVDAQQVAFAACAVAALRDFEQIEAVGRKAGAVVEASSPVASRVALQQRIAQTGDRHSRTVSLC